MNSINTGGPAFPRSGNEWSDMAWVEAPAKDGMTLRDYFAAKAMQGFISCGDPCNIELDVKAAYVWADFMLKAREA
jgi:hypothetical protein